MAQKQKRPSPVDKPPTASSSDSEEDQQPSSQQHEEEEEDNASSEESLSEEVDEEEEEEEHKPSTPLPPPSKTPKGKPLASKPLEQTTKAKPQPSASVPTKSGSKRAPENNVQTDPKRSKNKVTASAVSTAAGSDEEAEEDGRKSGDESSKKPFQRLWGEEDEIAILKGMVQFTSKTGMDPYKKANEFYDFVKKSLRADASSNQLKEKIRRLKKKFKNQAGRGKNGEDPKFSKTHDGKMFELSKKIWGDGEGGTAANGAVEKAKSNDETESGKMVIRYVKGMSMSGMDEDVLKRGLDLMGESKRVELKVRCMELQVAEIELIRKQSQLAKDLATWTLEAFKSSNH